LVGIVSLFAMDGEVYPDYIPFTPASAENFCMFSITAFIIVTLRPFVVDRSVNVYAKLCDIEDKIFIRVLFI